MTDTCGGCGEQITDVVLHAFGMAWHPYHLCCATCQKDFSEPGAQVEEGEDGFAYCTPCFQQAFAVICARCNEAIEGEYINALDKTWHPEHLTCEGCSKKLSDSFMPGDDGMPYCEKCYYTKKGLMCAECERPITIGKCVNFRGKKYHPEHFVCKFCKKNLQGGGHKVHDNKPYCKGCFVKLFG
mmetsp:Transcript_33247/g.81565  ORF Transcript_33247/g.81565 Transcript_33247/m.81565 type:complete len:184 (+) Transcript_33247:118-669(+)